MSDRRTGAVRKREIRFAVTLAHSLPAARTTTPGACHHLHTTGLGARARAERDTYTRLTSCTRSG